MVTNNGTISPEIVIMTGCSDRYYDTLKKQTITEWTNSVRVSVGFLLSAYFGGHANTTDAILD